MIGSFVVSCEEDGSFKKRQCHGSTGYCWCVDEKTGEKIQGTETRPGQKRVNCDDNMKKEEASRGNF